MQQLGSTKARFYRIVVAPKEAKRNGKFIEELGSYEPYPDSEKRKYVLLDFTRIKYWLGNGAQPMGLVRKLLGKANIMPSIPRGRHCNVDIHDETVSYGQDDMQMKYPHAKHEKKVVPDFTNLSNEKDIKEIVSK